MGVLFNGSQWAISTASYSRASSDHTVSLWLRFDSTGSNSRPFGNTGSWEMRTNAATVLTSDLLQAGTLGTVTLTVSSLHHMLVVQDVTGGNRYIYLDGALVNTVNSATFAGVQNGTMTIGAAPGGATQGWRGLLADFRIYNRVMTLEEAQTIYACKGTDGILDSIEHWWPMDEGVEGATVTNLVDVVAGLNCGNITGTPTYNDGLGLKTRRYA